jgi:hypothetical protein
MIGLRRFVPMELEIRQNERFQRREWRLERVGWALLAAFVVAGLAGGLGSGPVSWRTAASERGLVTVEYDRIAHYEADDAVRLTFSPEAVGNGEIAFEITGDWLAEIDRQSIIPQPSDEIAILGGVLLEVPVERPGTTAVTIAFRAQAVGALSGRVSVRGDDASFDQFVLP